MLTGSCHTFYWQGTDAHGNRHSGTLDASTKSEARVLLLKQGITAWRVNRTRGGQIAPDSNKKNPVMPRRRPRPAAITTMLEQLASLSKAGLPLEKALGICTASASDRHLQQVLQALRQDVTGGTTLHQSLARHPAFFDPVTIKLLKAGELTGQLDAMLERVVFLRQRQQQTRQQLGRALRYPGIVLTTAMVVCGILLTRVVPGFADSFSQFGAELPRLTQAVMRVSDFAREYAFTITMGLVTSVVATSTVVSRTQRGSRCWHQLVIRCPVVGPTVQAACVSRLCSTLTVALRSGLPLVEALQLSAPTIGNSVFHNAVNSIAMQVSQGNSLASCIRKTGQFPVMIVQMVTVGEEVGTLDTMLDKCGAHYQQLLDSRIARLTAALEPALMAFLGIVIGILMLAMYLPVFTLGSAL